MSIPLPIIDKQRYEPQLGSVVFPDEWPYAGRLVEADEIDRNELNAEWRITTSNGIVPTYPIRVEITGRTLRRHQGTWAVRCKVIFCNDCEPETESGGWIFEKWD